MASRIEWSKVKPSVVRSELVELAVAVGLMEIGWLGLPGLLLAVMAELVVTVALTHRFHPQRGMRRHLGDVAKMLAHAARTAPDPRLHWAGAALMRGGALVVGSLLAAFTCFLGGIPLAGLLALVVPERAPDLGIGFVFLATTGIMAIILSTMSERELADIAGQPYLD